MRFSHASLQALISAAIASLLTANPAAAQLNLCGPERAGGTAAQCLFTLRAALDLDPCEPACACNLDRVGGITATDALLCLKHVVGALEVDCPCPTCTSASLVIADDSSVDRGWNGLGHGQQLPHGYAVGLRFVRRCEDTPDVVCETDSDCSSARCSVACDCDDAANSQCELSGPTGPKYCVRDLTPCQTNADCPFTRCVQFLGPPQPHSVANTPACLLNYFVEDLTGTFDTKTGHASFSTFMRSHVSLGEALDIPCPRCGAPGEQPAVGDQFQCERGPREGDTCTVEAVSETFGGVSRSCPPYVSLAIFGEGNAVPLRNLTTGPLERLASIPCLFSGGCTDDGSECATNVDCTRCTDDLAPCTSNADCSSGTCASAPGQPISCGWWCHCGFCNDDPSRPCFGQEDCGNDGLCMPGSSSTGRQEQPNACSDLVCGRVEPERCCAEGDPSCPSPAPLVGRCSEAPYLSCSTSPGQAVCEEQGAGECLADNLPCFEHRTARSGQASPLASHCANEDFQTCVTNGDCAGSACTPDTAAPVLAALVCGARTASGAINAASGLPGPSALRLETRLFVCRCGDGIIGCDEACDDGNNRDGDGCSAWCDVE